MKEKIYTIPVTDAFKEACQCALCLLDKKLEKDYAEYVLGASLMEPDGRAETNKNGFCRKHFELLFNSHLNSHGLGLIMDTYLLNENEIIMNMFENKSSAIKKDSQLTIFNNITNKATMKQTETQKFIEEILTHLIAQESKCTICGKINYTMSRYIEVIFYLWLKEEEFKVLFNNKKGFCLKHFKLLLDGSRNHLKPAQTASFVDSLMDMQLKNMAELQKDVNWFTKKFDYRNNDAPWGNSKDSVSRSIQKIVGDCDLK